MATFFQGRKLFLLSAVFGLILLGCSKKTELQWNQEQGYQWAELSPGYFGETGFEQLEPSATNINFRNTASEENIKENRNYLNGSGVAAADVDGDGLVDLYFANLDGPNKLYKNIGGMEFRDITEQAGVAHKGYNSTGVVFADVDGDSDPDLLVTSLTETNELYINDGNGNFNLKKDSGLGPSMGSNTMALSDIDSDGDLDLYITNYKLKTARDIYTAQELRTQNTVRRQGDSLVVIPPYNQYYGIIKTDGQSYRNEYGERDELYINDGSGNFEKVESTDQHFLDAQGNPIQLPRDWGLTARFQDINNDELPDLYVANDFWTPDRFWINQGDGVFQLIDHNAIRNMSYSSMAVDFSDINKDGALDIFVTEMLSSNHQRRMRQLSEHLDPINGIPQYNKNSLYLNRGDNTFAEISTYSNLDATEWSWATNFLDVDLDGYEDLVITTGHAYDYQDMDTQIAMNRQAKTTGNLFEYPRLALRNQIYKNEGDLTFSDKSTDWGFGEEDISLGMAISDLDNDGDPDLAINRFDQSATVYQNQTNAPRIAIKLNSDTANTSAIGAKVELSGVGVPQVKEVTAGGNYVSGSEPALFFAADKSNPDHQLIITWPDGETSKIDSVKADRIYVVNKSTASENTENQVEKIANKEPIFEDVSGRISHTHHQDEYTDYNVQSLLPVKVSERGPGVSWIDYDRDNDEDLFITSGKGGSLAAFENNGGQFDAVQINRLNREASGDQTTLLGWENANGTNLILGSANFEQGDPGAPSAYHFTLNDNQNVDEKSIPGILSTTGPLAASDYDGDGDIDLFVGGSYNPAKYPQDASSRLFVYQNGSYRLDHTNSSKLSGIGLVSSAVFTDYDQDGDQDLLLSREWDSLLLFENKDGTFRDATANSGLQAYKGWWNSVTTGDFNNDGLPDIIATNIGKNSTYQIDHDQPLRLFYSDFNMDGSVDIIDSYYSPDLQAYVPRRKLFAFDSMPNLLGNIRTHEQFSKSTVSEVVGEDVNNVPYKELNTLDHAIFINNGDGFEPHALPEYAQFTTSMNASVLDYNNDGNEDLFLSQNLFPFPTYFSRQDAGRGLILQGDGTGNFEAVKGQKSGIKIYGEQRGAAVSDFNGDARADLVVTQNEENTKLYMNQSDRQGIRIRLVGSLSNRSAIGSSIRLVYDDGSKGPVREIQAGSGHWSQSGFIQVMGYSGKVTGFEIHWFDGSTETVEYSGKETELVIKYQN